MRPCPSARPSSTSGACAPTAPSTSVTRTRVAQQTDATLGTDYAPRVERFFDDCRDNDLAMAVARSDVKGVRSKGPAQQADPDQYVRIVSRDSQGIAVRGCKVHTSVSV